MVNINKQSRVRSAKVYSGSDQTKAVKSVSYQNNKEQRRKLFCFFKTQGQALTVQVQEKVVERGAHGD